MINIFTASLTAGFFGMSVYQVLGRSKVGAPFRSFFGRRAPLLKDLIECPLCLGFWASLAASLLFAWFGHLGGPFVPLTAFSGAGISLLTAETVDYFSNQAAVAAAMLTSDEASASLLSTEDDSAPLLQGEDSEDADG